ncbi:RNA-binding domain-containing protein [Cryphonectria parasitica EP155]|uniref:RNA-binding domain-containing protein n=1 Tax=Cryphonectria parasitica (strain ATCC 38755 / EP155) TaxID=660469 RepID=A0A9P4Y6T2_CRYP1|nr:RNA-binding domain-containing protein [Cryphonectria parasitica EP155]KAF3767977.1 RNA-binding domain-containing protein [Cryphonectria parasitica EP155]
MLFPEEDSPVLKDWIVKRLENTSDADADVLADYVLALLHNANDGANIQEVFEEEITPFLKEDTKLFANDLIETIKYKSYIPGAPPPPPKSQPALTSATATPQPSLGLTPPGQSPFPTGPAAGSRKRGFQDRGDLDAPNGRDQFQGGSRPIKQPRRGGRRGYVDPDRPRPVQQPQYGYPGAPGQNAPPPFLQQLQQQLQMQMAPFSDYGQQQQGFSAQRPGPQKRRGRCRDYDTKGYCARGQNCLYEHSNGSEAMYTLPTPQKSGQIQLPKEEHDPNNNSMMMLPPQLPNIPSAQQNKNFTPQRKDNRRGQQQRNNGVPRAPFSVVGPVQDRTKTKVVVESIPEENFDEAQVREFFSQFGNIEEVTMMPYKRLATVKFEKWDSANAAYKSPKAIFGNRFVKVFWYKDDKLAGNGKAGANGMENGTAATEGGAGASAGDDQEEGFDMEEFTRKQEEAQKIHEEKQRQKLELDKQRAELEKKQKELQAKQMAEKQRLLAKLGGAQKDSPASAAAVVKDEGTEGLKPSSTQTEALRATLAKLQEEAKVFGLDPDAQLEDDASVSTYAGYAPHGRGGFYKGRASYTPRASYRGGRGGRGNLHAAYAAFSLDNRPKKVALAGVDLSVPEKDEALRQHLFSLGEFAAEIQVTPAVTHISFNDRKAAENFYHSVNTKAVPGLSEGEGEEVQVSWVSNTAGPLPGSSTHKVDFSSSSSAAAANGAASADDGLDATATDPSAGATAHQGGSGGQAQQEAVGAEMDYDVAGENEWDVE